MKNLLQFRLPRKLRFALTPRLLIALGSCGITVSLLMSDTAPGHAQAGSVIVSLVAVGRWYWEWFEQKRRARL